MNTFLRVNVTFFDAVNIIRDVSTTPVGRNDNFRAMARKLSILPTSLDIFDIRQHYVRIPFICSRRHKNVQIHNLC